MRGLFRLRARGGLLLGLSWLALGDPVPGYAQSCPPKWSDRFRPADLSDGIWGSAVFDDGTGPALYVGGGFTMAGGEPAYAVARWNGVMWSPVGDGFDGGATELAVVDGVGGDGPALYAGGSFGRSGSNVANNIARWDGSAWVPLGDGTDGVVWSICGFDDGSGQGACLYATGGFTTAGGISASRVARWNGTSWSAVGSGVDGNVFAAVVGNGSLYVGGDFTRAGSTAASHVACWNGTHWTALGTGVDGWEVRTLAVLNDGSSDGPALFAGGNFGHAGDQPARNIAKWNGTAWSALGSGADSTVTTLTLLDDGSSRGPRLIAGGYFQSAGGVQGSPHIAAWDGAEWSAVGGGTDAAVQCLAVQPHPQGGGPTLFAGGIFEAAGAIAAKSVAQWDGATWSHLGPAAIGNAPDGSIWSMMACDLDGPGPGAPALFVGGLFEQVGAIDAQNVARWDGQAWSSLAGGVGYPGYSDRVVGSLAVYNDGVGHALYVGGQFATAGETTANSIARWDGAAWTPLGDGIRYFSSPGNVNALVVHDDGSDFGPALYVGGRFTKAGGLAAMGVARWNGVTWSSVGGGLNNNATVQALAVYDDGSGAGPALYAGGRILSAGGVPVSNLAKWDGVSWSAAGDARDGDVYCLAVHDDGTGNGPELYAGGSFLWIDSALAKGIAEWDGTSWRPLGSGIDAPSDGYVKTLLSFDDGTGAGPVLIAGGNFTIIDGTESTNVVRWNGTSWTNLGSGLDAGANALASFHDGWNSRPALYVGGYFARAGGVPSAHIARWGCPLQIGDLNCDGTVDSNDVNPFVLALIKPAEYDQQYADCNHLHADCNDDGVVNFADINPFVDLILTGE